MSLIVEDGYIAAQAAGKASKKWDYSIPKGYAIEDLKFSEDGSIYAFIRGQFIGDITHIHKLNKQGKELWSIRVSGVPVVGEKVLIDAHSRIDVYDLQTGKRKHQFSLPKGFKVPVSSYSSYLQGVAIAGPNDVFYLKNEEKDAMYAFYANGKTKWLFKSELGNLGDPIVDSKGNEFVYESTAFMPKNSGRAKLYALEGNGKIKWSRLFNMSGHVEVGKNSIYVLEAFDSLLHSVNKLTGEVQWSLPYNASWLDMDGAEQLYLLGYENSKDYCFVISPNGKGLWKVPIEIPNINELKKKYKFDTFYTSDMLRVAYDQVILFGNTNFMMGIPEDYGFDSHILSYNNDGTKRWSKYSLHTVKDNFFDAAIGYDGSVYGLFNQSSRAVNAKLSVFSPSGSLVQTIPLDPLAENVLFHEGIVYVFGEMNKLSAFQTNTLPKISIFIDGNKQQYSVNPVSKDNTVLVPMRDIFESLGAKVKWDPATKTISASKGDTHLTMQIGSTTATINGKKVQLQASPTIEAGSTLVPIRLVGEGLGAKVAWESSKRNIVINTK